MSRSGWGWRSCSHKKQRQFFRLVSFRPVLTGHVCCSRSSSRLSRTITSRRHISRQIPERITPPARKDWSFLLVLRRLEVNNGSSHGRQCDDTAAAIHGREHTPRPFSRFFTSSPVSSQFTKKRFIVGSASEQVYLLLHF